MLAEMTHLEIGNITRNIISPYFYILLSISFVTNNNNKAKMLKLL